MIKPKWLYSWSWSEADEIRLSQAAASLDSLADTISGLAQDCYEKGQKDLSNQLVTDAGFHFVEELANWKQKLNSDVVDNLRLSAKLIRNTIDERTTIWDKFQKELADFFAWEKEQE